MLVLQAIAEGKIHTVVITTVEKNIALLHIQNNWSFEAGAIAKILNLDDECLKGAKYYPYDLAHFKADDCK